MNVGDYVRTDTGIIQKIGKIYEQNETNDTHIQLNRMGTGKSVFILDNDKELSYSKGEVIKSSPNIIDLIEVGDYVNGFEVLRIDKECNLYPKTLKCQYPNNVDYFDIFNEDIKSVVTKEQFEAIKYEIK